MKSYTAHILKKERDSPQQTHVMRVIETLKQQQQQQQKQTYECAHTSQKRYSIQQNI
jgi:hypothetical protein